MKTHSRKYASARIFVSLTAPLAMLLGGFAGAGTAQAESCSPLQIASLIPVNARVIRENNRPTAISFHLAATVKNTNRKAVYVGNNETVASFTAHDTDRKRQLSESHKMGTHIAPGGNQRIISGQVVVKRKDNRTPITTQLHGSVANFHCKGIIDAFVSISEFKYDLTPILSGGKAKRLSGRIRGASETTPPRRGNGAPAPRRRTGG